MKRKLKKKNNLIGVFTSERLKSLDYHCIGKLSDFGYVGSDDKGMDIIEQYWLWTNDSQYVLSYSVGSCFFYIDIPLSERLQNELRTKFRNVKTRTAIQL